MNIHLVKTYEPKELSHWDLQLPGIPIGAIVEGFNIYEVCIEGDNYYLLEGKQEDRIYYALYEIQVGSLFLIGDGWWLPDYESNHEPNISLSDYNVIPSKRLDVYSLWDKIVHLFNDIL
jgi:hypothetical protein